MPDEWAELRTFGNTCREGPRLGANGPVACRNVHPGPMYPVGNIINDPVLNNRP